MQNIAALGLRLSVDCQGKSTIRIIRHTAIKADNLIKVLAVIHKRRHLEPEEIPREQ